MRHLGGYRAFAASPRSGSNSRTAGSPLHLPHFARFARRAPNAPGCAWDATCASVDADRGDEAGAIQYAVERLPSVGLVERRARHRCEYPVGSRLPFSQPGRVLATPPQSQRDLELTREIDTPMPVIPGGGEPSAHETALHLDKPDRQVKSPHCNRLPVVVPCDSALKSRRGALRPPSLRLLENRSRRRAARGGRVCRRARLGHRDLHRRQRRAAAAASVPIGERFASVYGARTTQPGVFMGMSVPELREHQQQTTSFDAFGWFSTGPYRLTAPGEPQFVPGAAVTPALARQVGPPLLGQWFADDSSAVISSALWRRLGGGRDIIGSAITLDKRRYTVSGVMPPAFQMPVAGTSMTRGDTEVWIPFDPSPTDDANLRNSA